MSSHWYSEVVAFNLADGTFSEVHNEAMREGEIMTFSEGLQEFLPGGDVFVEEQNSGVLWVLGEKASCTRTSCRRTTKATTICPTGPESSPRHDVDCHLLLPTALHTSDLPWAQAPSP